MAEDTKTMDKKDKSDGELVETPGKTPVEGGDGQQVKITLDDSSLEASYSNFCRVTGTPEEVIVDFALNPNPFSRQDQTVKVDKRLVMNHYTAKRLFAALQQTILRHEQNFGVIELNVQRRLSPANQPKP
ncbi:MAG: DUF3467 domain-containing protein [Planctomycetes bacterium]|nr:DUF3467 domain-containing protein [Planctomycetota bacterium]